MVLSRLVEPPEVPYVLGDLSIDYAARRVTLAAKEYAVLYQLAVQAPRVLTHGLLLQRVWEAERMG
ncbi:MAG: response regulator transcription factor [Chloroflexi bacterium]|nr:response regulator transcription factor [Chloroflexota bacterium]MYE39800.1 response regulator transcription factor [Chloroflexota bacterium]